MRHGFFGLREVTQAIRHGFFGLREVTKAMCHGFFDLREVTKAMRHGFFELHEAMKAMRDGFFWLRETTKAMADGFRGDGELFYNVQDRRRDEKDELPTPYSKPRLRAHDHAHVYISWRRDGRSRPCGGEIPS